MFLCAQRCRDFAESKLQGCPVVCQVMPGDAVYQKESAVQTITFAISKLASGSQESVELQNQGLSLPEQVVYGQQLEKEDTVWLHFSRA